MKPDINQGVKLFLKRGCRVKAGSFILLMSLIRLLYALWNLTLERFSYHLEKMVSVSVLSANGWKDQNVDSSFCPQGKPWYGEGIVQLANRVVVWRCSIKQRYKRQTCTLKNCQANKFLKTCMCNFNPFNLLYYKFVHSCLHLYLLCYLYFLLLFWAIIITFHSICYQFLQLEFC